MKWFLRIGGIVLCLIMGWVKTPVLKVSSGDSDDSQIRYVALGDSIASGYGLKNPDKESYVSRVEQYLETRYDSVFCSNLGYVGLESEELLERLTDEENKWYRKYCATLTGADIVTLSIGSNDLLHLLKADGSIQETIASGDSVFREACRSFAITLPKIIQVIHNLSPHAVIYVNNVYNPCHDLTQYASLYGLADGYISLLNEPIQEEEGFVEVDVKSAFDSSEEKMLNVTVNRSEVDPHPNADGHKRIAEAVIEKIKENE